MLKNDKQTPFILLTVAVIITFVIGRLVCYNMFIDGVLYNSVARNLAHGKGSFWFPHFGKNSMSFFHEQPPLTFFIESFFFRLSDSIWIERLYSFTTFCVNAWLITKIWRSATSEHLHRFDWLPVLAWTAIPCVNYAFYNCLEENTMSIFVLLTVWLQTQVIFHQKSYLYSLLAGFTLILAALCKGFPGLFPLVFMGVAWLFGFLKFQKALSHGFSTLFVFSLCGLALYLYPVSHESLGTYLHERVINSINNVACQSSRTWIFSHFCKRVYVQLLVAGIATYWLIKQGKEALILFKNAQLFVTLSLLGILPLMVTMEQRGQYLVTAMPYYALMIASLIAPALHILIEKASMDTIKKLNIFGGILLIGSIVYAVSRIGNCYDNAEKTHDYFIFQKEIPAGTEIHIPGQLWNDWDLQCNMNRLGSMDLNGNPNDSLDLHYFITQKDSTFTIPAGYQLQKLPTQYYDLYKK